MADFGLWGMPVDFIITSFPYKIILHITTPQWVIVRTTIVHSYYTPLPTTDLLN
jgi:hypothetical protein